MAQKPVIFALLLGKTGLKYRARKTKDTRTMDVRRNRDDYKRRISLVGVRQWLMLIVAIHLPLVLILGIIDFLQPLRTALLPP